MEINVILSESFEKWLKTLEYAESTVYLSVRYVNDFFFYLKSKDIKNLEQINPATITGYYKHLQTRPQKKQTGGLSQNYIVSNINAIKRFSKYLQVTGKGNLEIILQIPVNKATNKTILSQEEIKALYQATDNTELGIRDRAILGIYYGCGLRRSEGTALNVKDVMYKERLVFVRGGKGNKERYVPMTERVKDDLLDYIFLIRDKVKRHNQSTEEALFLSERGKRMHGNSIINRLHQMATKAKIQKEIGLHTLRHSIATHLLQSGMTLEEVSQFLGHSSLESTQIYTHLAHE
ncbi:MAG: tyrosine-type recombinase/integrase [Bacteroidales bacterium]|nr:tyrosine-type recombinase/integrase [Bacteroidales bacterium]MBW6479337.1 tyrosine-type recombinase/integrase [Bacteroidales bacterium]